MGAHSVSVEALVNLMVGSDAVGPYLKELAGGVSVPINLGGGAGAGSSLERQLKNFNGYIASSEASITGISKRLKEITSNRGFAEFAKQNERVAKSYQDLYRQFSGAEKLVTQNGTRSFAEELQKARIDIAREMQYEKIAAQSGGKFKKGKSGAYSYNGIQVTESPNGVTGTVNRITQNYKMNNSGMARQFAAEGIEVLMMDIAKYAGEAYQTRIQQLMTQGTKHGGVEYEYFGQSATHAKEGKVMMVRKGQAARARQITGGLSDAAYQAIGTEAPKARAYNMLGTMNTKAMVDVSGNYAKPNVVVLPDAYIENALTDAKGKGYRTTYNAAGGGAAWGRGEIGGSKTVMEMKTDGALLLDPKFAKKYGIDSGSQMRMLGSKGFGYEFDFKAMANDMVESLTTQNPDMTRERALDTKIAQNGWDEAVTIKQLLGADIVQFESSLKQLGRFKNLADYNAQLNDPMYDYIKGTKHGYSNTKNKSSYSMTQWLDYSKLSAGEIDVLAQDMAKSLKNVRTNASQYMELMGTNKSSPMGKFLSQYGDIIKTDYYQKQISERIGKVAANAEGQIEFSGKMAEILSGRSALSNTQYGNIMPEFTQILEGFMKPGAMRNINGKNVIDTTKAKYRMGKGEIVSPLGALGEGYIGRYPMNGLWEATNVGQQALSKYYGNTKSIVLSNATPWMTALAGADFDGDTAMFMDSLSKFAQSRAFREPSLNFAEINKGELSWDIEAQSKQMRAARESARVLGDWAVKQTDVLTKISKMTGMGTETMVERANRALDAAQIIKDLSVDVAKKGGSLAPWIEQANVMMKEMNALAKEAGFGGTHDYAKELSQGRKNGKSIIDRAVITNPLTERIKDLVNGENYTTELTQSQKASNEYIRQAMSRALGTNIEAINEGVANEAYNIMGSAETTKKAEANIRKKGYIPKGDGGQRYLSNLAVSAITDAAGNRIEIIDEAMQTALGDALLKQTLGKENNRYKNGIRPAEGTAPGKIISLSEMVQNSKGKAGEITFKANGKTYTIAEATGVVSQGRYRKNSTAGVSSQKAKIEPSDLAKSASSYMAEIQGRMIEAGAQGVTEIGKGIAETLRPYVSSGITPEAIKAGATGSLQQVYEMASLISAATPEGTVRQGFDKRITDPLIKGAQRLVESFNGYNPELYYTPEGNFTEIGERAIMEYRNILKGLAMGLSGDVTGFDEAIANARKNTEELNKATEKQVTAQQQEVDQRLDTAKSLAETEKAIVADNKARLEGAKISEAETAARERFVEGTTKSAEAAAEGSKTMIMNTEAAKAEGEARTENAKAQSEVTNNIMANGETIGQTATTVQNTNQMLMSGARGAGSYGDEIMKSAEERLRQEIDPKIKTINGKRISEIEEGKFAADDFIFPPQSEDEKEYRKQQEMYYESDPIGAQLEELVTNAIIGQMISWQNQGVTPTSEMMSNLESNLRNYYTEDVVREMFPDLAAAEQRLNQGKIMPGNEGWIYENTWFKNDKSFNPLMDFQKAAESVFGGRGQSFIDEFLSAKYNEGVQTAREIFKGQMFSNMPIADRGGNVRNMFNMLSGFEEFISSSQFNPATIEELTNGIIASKDLNVRAKEGLELIKSTFTQNGGNFSEAMKAILDGAPLTEEVAQNLGELYNATNLSDLAYGGKNFAQIFKHANKNAQNNSAYSAALDSARSPQERAYYQAAWQEQNYKTQARIADAVIEKQLRDFRDTGANANQELVFRSTSGDRYNQLMGGSRKAVQEQIAKNAEITAQLGREFMLSEGMATNINEFLTKSIAKKVASGGLDFTSLKNMNPMQAGAWGNMAQLFRAAATGYVGSRELSAEELAQVRAQRDSVVQQASAMTFKNTNGLSGMIETAKVQSETMIESARNVEQYRANMDATSKAIRDSDAAYKDFTDTTRKQIEQAEGDLYTAKKAASEAAQTKVITEKVDSEGKTIRTEEITDNEKIARQDAQRYQQRIDELKASQATRDKMYAEEQAALKERGKAEAEQWVNAQKSRAMLGFNPNSVVGAKGMGLQQFGKQMTNMSNQAMMEMMGAQMVFEQFKGIVSGMYSYVEAFDSQMREYKKIQPNWNEKDMRSYVRGLSDMGQTYGKTVEEMAEASIVMTRGGYGGADAASKQINRGMTEAALLMSNIADEELSVSDASDQLISVTKAYGVQNTDAAAFSTRFADMVNEVSNNFSVTSNALAEATPIVSSAAAVSGISIEELIGLITGGAEIKQSMTSL